MLMRDQGQKCILSHIKMQTREIWQRFTKCHTLIFYMLAVFPTDLDFNCGSEWGCVMDMYHDEETDFILIIILLLYYIILY